MPATPENVTVARQALSGLADARGWDDPFTADVKIALSEACSNVVVHAYPDGGAGPLIVRAWADEDELVIAILDEGAGVTPTIGARPGLGLGLPLLPAVAATWVAGDRPPE